MLLVYGLHLKSNVLDEAGGQPTNVLLREEASRQVLAHEEATAAAWARTDRLRLVIVGGDLNTSLDDPKFAAETTLRDWLGAGGFRWGWEAVPLLRRLTLPGKGRYPATCFDHVFYRAADGTVKMTLRHHPQHRSPTPAITTPSSRSSAGREKRLCKGFTGLPAGTSDGLLASKLFRA